MTDPISTLKAHRRLVSALKEPHRYAWPVDRVEAIETHISTVLLAGDYVLKLKKPLDLGFLNFVGLERRRYFCEEEIRLNSRLAPQIYLRRIPITGSLSDPRIDGESEAIEHAVLMLRFPENELMDRLLREGRLPDKAVERLAETVADFHARLPAAGTDSDYGLPEMVAKPLRDNFEQLAALSEAEPLRRELHTLQRWSERQLERLSPLMLERREKGAVRECHGDMHLGNVAWHEGRVIVFDGIEFDPGLRWIDTVSEIAFTVMDLDFMGARHLRHRFLNRYLERTGDYQALALLPFYAVYRALVRAKINAQEAEQGGGSRANEALAEHVNLASAYTSEQTPELIITYGLAGSGKSTLSGQLVEEQSFVRLRSDVERKRLFGLDPRARSRSELDSGLYTPEATDRTYSRLLELAQVALEAGFSVVVDASFLRSSRRRPFRDLAERLGCRFRILHIRANEDTLRKRLRKRSAEARDPSEADESVLDAQMGRAEPPSGEEMRFVRTIDQEAR